MNRGYFILLMSVAYQLTAQTATFVFYKVSYWTIFKSITRNFHFKKMFALLISRLSLLHPKLLTTIKKILVNDLGLSQGLSQGHESKTETESGSESKTPVGYLDLVLLGVGEDGHTCSLFPGHRLVSTEDAVNKNGLLVTWLTDSPKVPASRMTLTLTALVSCRYIAFVSSGAGKKEIIKQILCDQVHKPDHAISLPAALVTVRALRHNIPVSWWLDQASAQLLDKKVAMPNL